MESDRVALAGAIAGKNAACAGEGFAEVSIDHYNNHAD
jgi:hypothetical protein